MILSKLDHPSVLKMFDRFRTKEFYYLITEHCNGGDLRRYLKKKGFLKEAEVQNIARQLVEALCYIHKDKSIIHRDIKPSNILIKENNRDNIQKLDTNVQE